MSRALDKIKHAKQQANIVEIIGRYVDLKKDGANWKGFSPFCQERTPSFIVSPSKNIFKCYSSGYGGDALDFVCRLKGVTIFEAIKLIGIDTPAELPEYIPTPPIPVSYMERSVMFSTLKGYEQNDFAQFLFAKFGMQAVKALADYRVGTSRHKFWHKDHQDYVSMCKPCIFWYVDIQERVRSGKIMGYNPDNCKRIKEPFPHVMWVNRLWANGKPLYPDFNLSVCLFGEHLLSRPGDVHIFESEKTAIVASLCYPEWVCLGSGSLTNLTVSRCSVLSGRNNFLHSDSGAELKWIEKISELKQFISAEFNHYDMHGPNIKGYDFCDWIFDNLI